MARAFPARADCSEVPAVDAIPLDYPMLPCAIDDDCQGEGGSPDQVEDPAGPFGEALLPPLASPVTTSRGGGGGSSLTVVEVLSTTTGDMLTVQEVRFLTPGQRPNYEAFGPYIQARAFVAGEDP